ncbi:M56 family metallopeptidase [Acetivibrio clariflavus]|uniref:M56 family metallopeptidase n=1 Tax=Acetivibrio clariflavus TaxID=288965 RepID=UPI0031F51E27
MNDFIKTLLSLSLSGSIIALILLSLKPILKYRIPKAIQYYMWGIILLRLLLPLSLPGSIMNAVFSEERVINSETNYTSISETTNIDTVDLPPVFNSLPDKNVYNTATSKNSLKFNYKCITLLWLIGFLATLVINLFGYARFIRYVNKTNLPAKPEEVNTLFKLSKKDWLKLYRNPFISTPMLIGVVKPRIIIPDIEFDKDQLNNILLHELTHLKRFDIVIKWFTMLTVAIHWFNPVVYLIRKEIDNACELACDEAVIKNLSDKDKQSYGNTLIYVVSKYKEAPLGMLQAKMYEEKKTLKERLTSIMKYNKKPKIIIFLSIVLLLSIVAGSLALGAFNGKSSNKNNGEKQIENKYEVYKNDKYGFSLNIPESFSQYVNIDENNEENVIYFRYKEISRDYPLMGHVGRIEVYDKEQYPTKEDLKDKEDMYNFKILGESDKFYYGWAHATDLQVPQEKNELLEKFRELEREFENVIESFKVHNAEVKPDENEESAPQTDGSHIEYSLIYKNNVIRLGDWDTNNNIEDIFGTPKEQNIEILGPGSDTFIGTYKKVIKYDNIEFTLFSPKDDGKSFWITEILVKDNSIKTYDGIAIGASLQELKSTYSDIKVFPDGRTDINNCAYILDRVDFYKLMKFEVKNGKVEEIKLYIEIP